MRIPIDADKTVTSTGASQAMRLDGGSANGARRISITNKTGVDLLVWRTDTETTPNDTTVTNTIVTANWVIKIPDGKYFEDECDDNLKYFGAIASGTGTVRVQEKTN